MVVGWCWFRGDGEIVGTKLVYEQFLFDFDDNKVLKYKLDMLMYVQVCMTIKQNSYGELRILYLKENIKSIKKLWREAKVLNVRAQGSEAETIKLWCLGF
jgi:hypothetical protein